MKTAPAHEASAPEPAEDTSTSLEDGNGGDLRRTRLITLYGPPKCRKTTACASVTGAKWIVADSNCLPTLDAQDAVPAGKDIYRINSSREAKALLDKMIDAAKTSKLKVPVVIDSITQLSDWLQQDIAAETGQVFMGQVKENNGWQQFNAEMGTLIDTLGSLATYVTVIVIAHAKEKVDAAKGEWSGLNLPPQMALRLGRVTNWALFQEISSRKAIDGDTNDEFTQIVDAAGGAKMAVTCVIHTQTIGLWMAGVNAHNLKAEEPADMGALLRKEKLL